MDSSEHDDWKKFTVTVKHNRKGKKSTKTLTFDLSHVVQPMQMQFVVTHDKRLLEEFLEKQGANLSDCSLEHIVLSLESSGTVDEVSVQATNLILHFLLEYDTKPFYLSEDEAEQKYGMKEQIRKVCQVFNVNVIWKEESNVIWIIGQLAAVKKCFLSLMTFCQGTSERTQTISQATFVDWEKCKQSAQTAVTDSGGTISKQKHQEELQAVEYRHKMFLEETGRKHKEELQRLTEEMQRMKKEKCKQSAQTAVTDSEGTISKQKHQEELQAVEYRHKMFLEETGRKHKEELQRLTKEMQRMKKNEDKLKRTLEAMKSKQDKLKIQVLTDKDKSEGLHPLYWDTSYTNFVTREGLTVRVYAGSILHLDVDCIVNAANENLQHGGGIAMVISRAAGYEFDRESRDYINNHGSLNVGECCTTSAGDLKYKGVIHTVGPRWYDYPNNQTGCLDDLTQAVKAVMIECDYQGFTKVAIPAISSGIFGVPRDLCAQQYYRAVTEYSAQHWGRLSSLAEVYFVDKDQGMVDLIARTFFENCQKDAKMNTA